MRILFLSLLLAFVFTAPTIAQEITNDFVLKNVRFEKSDRGEGLNLILEGEGSYERTDYPILKVFINDKLVSDNHMYVIILEDRHEVQTTLTEIPENFECLVVITNMSFTESDVFVHKQEKVTKTKKNTFELKKVSLIKKDNLKFLRLDFKPFEDTPFGVYPLFKVEMDGKVIAERGLQTYAMTKVELIPTDLETLPEHFKIELTIGSQDSKREVTVEYEQ